MPRLDVKRDGIIDILDLILVARHFGETVAQTAAIARYPSFIDRERILTWIAEARTRDDGSAFMRDGIRALTRLLALTSPTSTSLGQNYPNPFNPSTTISFTSTGEPVTIRVYDTIGREIATLVDGTPGAGRFSVSFDASSLPAGVYYYRMTSGGFRDVKTMNLIK